MIKSWLKFLPWFKSNKDARCRTEQAVRENIEAFDELSEVSDDVPVYDENLKQSIRHSIGPFSDLEEVMRQEEAEKKDRN